MPYQKIPRTAGDIDCSRLSARLKNTGTLHAETHVKEVTAERAGPGVAGNVFRLHLGYANGEGPPTVIVKLNSSTSFSLNRFPHKLSTEAGFYRDIGASCGLHVPECLFMAHDLEGGSFCLILEDVGVGRDSIVSSIRFTESEWRYLFSDIVNMHAMWWESPKLSSLHWLRTFEDDVNRRIELLPGILADFLPRWSSKLESVMVDLFTRLPTLLRATMDYLKSSPRTLLHLDLNPGNLIFKETNGQLSMRVIDWQDVISGPVARDIWIPLSYTPVESRMTALNLYAEVLRRKFNIDYPEGRLAREVSACSLFGAFVAAGRGAIGTEAQDAVCQRMIDNRGPDWMRAAALLN